MKKGFTFLILGIAIIAGCRKGELPEEIYFGKVGVKQVKLADAKELDAYFNNEKIGTIGAEGAVEYFTLRAGLSGKLSIYRAGTDSLVVDTMVTIPKQQQSSFRVIASSSLGAYGFMAEESTGADSCKFKFINSLNPELYPYPELDVYVCNFKSTIKDTLAIIKGVKQGQMSPVVVNVSHLYQDAPVILMLKLKDPATGKWITHASATTSQFILITTANVYNTHLTLCQIADNGEDKATNKIIPKLTIID